MNSLRNITITTSHCVKLERYLFFSFEKKKKKKCDFFLFKQRKSKLSIVDEMPQVRSHLR